jgi:hypothetical protein
VLRSRKERRALGDERQHRQAQVAVQSQRHLRGAESSLGHRVGALGPLHTLGVTLTPALDNSGRRTQTSDHSPKSCTFWFQRKTRVPATRKSRFSILSIPTSACSSPL